MFTGPMVDQIMALDSLHTKKLKPNHLIIHAATLFATTHLPRYVLTLVNYNTRYRIIVNMVETNCYYLSLI